MGGRGTFANGNPVSYTYELDKSIEPSGRWCGIKILKGCDGSGKHGLPESAHHSNAYMKLTPDGRFREIRFYDKNHVLYLEIGYHKERNITGNNTQSVLHYHTYDPTFSKTKIGNGGRSPAIPLTKEMKAKYKKYFRGLEI